MTLLYYPKARLHNALYVGSRRVTLFYARHGERVVRSARNRSVTGGLDTYAVWEDAVNGDLKILFAFCVALLRGERVVRHARNPTKGASVAASRAAQRGI